MPHCGQKKDPPRPPPPPPPAHLGAFADPGADRARHGGPPAGGVADEGAGVHHQEGARAAADARSAGGVIEQAVSGEEGAGAAADANAAGGVVG